MMVTQTGQNTSHAADLMCDRCTAQVHIAAGHAVPRCPNCGNTTFSEVTAETAVAEGET